MCFIGIVNPFASALTLCGLQSPADQVNNAAVPREQTRWPAGGGSGVMSLRNGGSSTNRPGFFDPSSWRYFDSRGFGIVTGAYTSPGLDCPKITKMKSADDMLVH
ncbi:hypothetical protein GUJ93_ZPchr0006g42633 [Zizania palustris]|uniref:Uncharacterized protein n=1 Tax=Zizania palustris TaxID=103762 RepID=A0A8J5SE78_ZIZPA|nr:hypothetical protein GUJ93_ZPchr0006g42633 [Zizania palustris]